MRWFTLLMVLLPSQLTSAQQCDPNNPPVLCESCDNGFFLENEVCSECNLKNITSQTSIESVTCNAESLSINFANNFFNHSCVASQNFIVGAKNISSCPQSLVPVNQGLLDFQIDDCSVQKTNTPRELIFKLEFEIVEAPIELLHGLILAEAQVSRWSVSCTFDRMMQVEVQNSVEFNVQEEEFETNVDQDFQIQMQTFSDRTYANALSSPVVKNFGDELFFEISFDDAALAGQSSNFHLITESCWASPDVTQISETNVTLIDNECESVAYAPILDIVDPRSNSNVDQWNSRVFKFPDEGAQVVIQCRVRICYDANDCQRDCSGSRSAGRGRNGKKTLEKTVSSGLIVLGGNNESSAIRIGYAGFLALALGLCF